MVVIFVEALYVQSVSLDLRDYFSGTHVDVYANLRADIADLYCNQDRKSLGNFFFYRGVV